MSTDIVSAADINGERAHAPRFTGFFETCLMHMDEFAVLERRIKDYVAAVDRAIRDGDITTLADLSLNVELQQDIAIFRLRSRAHLGRAFNSEMTLAEALDAEPDVMAAALGVEPDVLLKDWMTQGCQVAAA